MTGVSNAFHRGSLFLFFQGVIDIFCPWGDVRICFFNFPLFYSEQKQRICIYFSVIIGLSEQTLVLKTPRRQGKSRIHAPIP